MSHHRRLDRSQDRLNPPLGPSSTALPAESPSTPSRPKRLATCSPAPQKSVSVTLAPASAEDRVLNVGPKGRTNIRVYRPENAEGTLPVNDTLTRRVRPGS